MVGSQVGQKIVWIARTDRPHGFHSNISVCMYVFVFLFLFQPIACDISIFHELGRIRYGNVSGTNIL